MRRRDVTTVGDLFKELVRESGLDKGLEQHHVYKAWDEVVGARLARYTTSKYFKEGRLICTISSSVARHSLIGNRTIIITRINQKLGREVVKELRVR